MKNLPAPLPSLLLGALLALAGACGSTLPGDLAGYQERCQRLNAQPIPRAARDPHDGVKNVYACNVPQQVLQANTRPFPDGTVIIKESTRDGEPAPWLMATARKQAGAWKWNEYTRNNAQDPFRHILAPESVCTGCHDRAEDEDWIFTRYDR